MAGTLQIDLNADLGEADRPDAMIQEYALLPLISSANVACGFHAGGPLVMCETVRRAVAAGCAVGAHPSYPDRAGFGRRFVDATADEIAADILYQLGALAAFCHAEGTRLTHVKPHGALYNRACVDEMSARAIAQAIAAFDGRLALVGLPGSSLIAAAAHCALPAIREGFADRAYNADGTLVSRRLPGAMIQAPAEVAHRALRMVQEGLVTAIDGREIALQVDTICLHGDAPGAAERAHAIRDALSGAGIVVAPPPPRV